MAKANLNDIVSTDSSFNVEKLAKLRLAAEQSTDRILDKNRKKTDAERLKIAQQQEEKNARAIAQIQTNLEREAKRAAADEQRKLENELRAADLQARLENSKLINNKFVQGVAEFGKKLDSITSANGKSLLQNAINAIGSSVEKYTGVYAQYMGSIEARIQGAGFTYSNINDVIKKNAAANPFYRYTDVLQNVAKLVEAGVSDNVAQRAFFETLSDKIATTFNAAEGSLLEIIRIQQQDSTASRLGMEAALTRTLNHYFNDTSYLSNSFDNVQAALIDLSSTLSSQTSVEFEYIVQKWLGSLGSVGVGTNTLQSIAQGINYLGTGNVDALTGNQALQNLLVMGANNAGLDYGAMLTNGINSVDANKLMVGIIELVQGISNSSNVVKSQYAELFGMTISDISAFSNLNNSVIQELSKSAMTYENTLQELNSQLNQVASRTHISEMIDNVLTNIMTTTGMGIANNAGAYGVYKAADMLESITGGINLPFISAFGTGIDLNMSLEGLMKGGIIGISAIGSLISGLGNLFSGGFLDANRWSLPNQKSGFVGYNNLSGVSTSTSTTATSGNTNSTGISQSLADTQKESGEEVNGQSDEKSDIQIILEHIQYILDEGTIRVNVQNTVTTRPVTLTTY